MFPFNCIAPALMAIIEKWTEGAGEWLLSVFNSISSLRRFSFIAGHAGTHNQRKVSYSNREACHIQFTFF